MVRIIITPAAYAAIKATLAKGVQTNRRRNETPLAVSSSVWRKATLTSSRPCADPARITAMSS